MNQKRAYYIFRVVYPDEVTLSKDINDIVFCMHDNWKHDIVLCISKVYGKFK